MKLATARGLLIQYRTTDTADMIAASATLNDQPLTPGTWQLPTIVGYAYPAGSTAIYSAAFDPSTYRWLKTLVGQVVTLALPDQVNGGWTRGTATLTVLTPTRLTCVLTKPAPVNFVTGSLAYF